MGGEDLMSEKERRGFTMGQMIKEALMNQKKELITEFLEDLDHESDHELIQKWEGKLK